MTFLIMHYNVLQITEPQDMLRLCPKICVLPCAPQPMFQPSRGYRRPDLTIYTKGYVDYRWTPLSGIYKSTHLNGEDYIGKAAKQAPGLSNVRYEMPNGYLIELEKVRSLRLKTRTKNPGKVPILGVVPGRHMVLPLSASSRSMLPPSVANIILHVPPSYSYKGYRKVQQRSTPSDIVELDADTHGHSSWGGGGDK